MQAFYMKFRNMMLCIKTEVLFHCIPGQALVTESQATALLHTKSIFFLVILFSNKLKHPKCSSTSLSTNVALNMDSENLNVVHKHSDYNHCGFLNSMAVYMIKCETKDCLFFCSIIFLDVT